MTHVFETTTNDYNLISNGSKQFDILKFGRSVSVGDKIIYQRLADTDEETDRDEEQINDTPYSDDELAVSITHIYEDAEGALKKGYVAVGFKEKES